MRVLLLWDGVRYNGSLVQDGWAEPAFRPPAWAEWAPAVLISPPTDPLVFNQRAIPPMVKHPPKGTSPLSFWRVHPGIFVADFGTSIAGYTTINLAAPSPAADGAPRKGEFSIRALHGELLYGPKGVVQNQFAVPPHSADECAHYGSCAQQIDTYTLPAEHGAVLLEPSFTFHGFRYVQFNVSDAAFEMHAGMVVAYQLYSDVKTTGTFSSNSTLLNDIQGAILQSVLGNLQSMSSDCPSREKRGWMGDAQVRGTPLALSRTLNCCAVWFLWLGDAQWSAENNDVNFDMRAMYANWYRTIADTQAGGCIHADAASPPPAYCLKNPVDAVAPPAWAAAAAASLEGADADAPATALLPLLPVLRRRGHEQAALRLLQRSRRPEPVLRRQLRRRPRRRAL